MKKLRKSVYQLLEPTATESTPGKIIEIFLICLVFLNIIAIVLESVKSINDEYAAFFADLEVFSVIVFSIEYVLRIWTADENPKFHFKKRTYIFSSIAIIDLLSILPFYLELLFPLIAVDLRTLRIIRLLRLLRLLKIARYLKALNIMQYVLRERKEQMTITIVFIMFLLVIVSTIMFYTEHDAQPEKFSSIPATMWWGIETLTTVGYGDLVPITPFGRILGGIIAILGIGLFALPAGIFSSGLTEYFYKQRKKAESNNCCPHCGKEIEAIPDKRS